jgi:uncharacterized protein YjiS (DUF1127 family)
MFVNRMLARVQAWQERQVTVRALQALDTRELDDLQIGRWQIGQIARGAPL